MGDKQISDKRRVDEKDGKKRDTNSNLGHENEAEGLDWMPWPDVHLRLREDSTASPGLTDTGNSSNFLSELNKSLRRMVRRGKAVAVPVAGTTQEAPRSPPVLPVLEPFNLNWVHDEANEVGAGPSTSPPQHVDDRRSIMSARQQEKQPSRVPELQVV